MKDPLRHFEELGRGPVGSGKLWQDPERRCDVIRILWQDCLCSRGTGLKTASTEPGRLNERRSNEVNCTCAAVAGEEEVESVRQEVSSRGKKNAPVPPSSLPCVPQPCDENRDAREDGVWEKEAESTLSVGFLGGHSRRDG